MAYQDGGEEEDCCHRNISNTSPKTIVIDEAISCYSIICLK